MKFNSTRVHLVIPLILIGIIALFFLGIHTMYANTSNTNSRLLPWMADAWMDGSGNFMHGWAVPVLFIAFIGMAWKSMKSEPIHGSLWGLSLIHI